MKNLVTGKSIFLSSLCIAGTLFLAASCSDNKTADSKDVAQQENINRLSSDDTILVIDNDNDAKFLMDVAEMQMEDISLGKLAQQKGNSAHVKALGKMMVTDHTKSLNEIKALAQSKSISIPSAETDNSKNTVTKLGEKTGNEFGIAYSNMMIEHHEDAIKKFENVSTGSKDSAIRTWATEKLPGLRTHLKHAEACKVECDKMKS